jgi:hypothetical protein
MSTYTLPPPNISGPLSKRAVQILRELQGLRLLDPNIPVLSDEVKQSNASVGAKATSANARIEPTFGAAMDATRTTQPNSAPKQPKRISRQFSRDAYFADVRSNLLGHVIFYVSLFLVLLVLSVYSALNYFGPMAQDLKKQYEIIPTIPATLKSINEQLQAKTKQRDVVQTQHANLQAFFPNAEQAYASYGGFLTLLEGQKVWVTGQSGTVSQSPSNPLVAQAMTAKDQRAKAEASGAKAAPATKPNKLSLLRGDIKPGLNYYHLEFTLEGSYVGYLAARQALVNENPNLVVHTETVITPKEGDTVLQITAFISIPFVNTP